VRAASFVFVGFTWMLAACRTQPERASKVSPEASPEVPKMISSEPQPALLEIATGDANADTPIVVAIHGMGDSAANFSRFVARYRGAARFILPQAPTRFHNGFSWFEFLPNMSDADFGKAIAVAEEGLWKAVGERIGTKRFAVLGFSQGGILSFAMAAKHADQVVCALPMAGSLPESLMPPKGGHVAPTYAFHGAADPLIDVKYARQSIAHFKEFGGISDLREYPNTPHTVSPEMERDVTSRLAECLR